MLPAVPDTSGPPQPTLRERTREAVRDEVRRHAIELFTERGFDATRTDDIAAAVGISPRSFFRYFATKEDVLVGGSIAFGSHVRAALEARPAHEPVWTSLRRALDPLVTAMADERRQSLETMTIIMSAGSLRAHHFEKHLAWERELVPVVEQRLEPAHDKRLRAQTLTHTALACLDVALAAWVESADSVRLSDLLDGVFAQVSDL